MVENIEVRIGDILGSVIYLPVIITTVPKKFVLSETENKFHTVTQR